MSNSNGSSTTNVTIPNNINKTIKNIKEITKNHSEDDIYAMLKECSMDPNETTQRLLYLDTFHQVKSKRDKRKEVVKSRQGDDSRWNHRHHERWTRGAQGNTSHYQYNSNDAGGQRGNFSRKENGVEDLRDKGFRKPTASILKEIDIVQPPHVEKALSLSTNGPVKMPNGNLGNGPYSKPYRVDDHCSKESVEQISTKASADIPVGSGLDKTESTSNSHLKHSDHQDVDGSPTSSSMVEQEDFKSGIIAQPIGLREVPADDRSHVTSSISSVTPSSVQGVDPLAGEEEAASKLAKLKFFEGQHVIIPDHLQVPDAVKDVLSFGSINAGFSVGRNYVKISNIKNLHSAGDAASNEATENLSSCYKDPVSAVSQEDHTDDQQSQPHVRDENYPVDTKISLSASNDYQLKEDNFPAVDPPFPIYQTAPNYCFGFMPPMLANTLMQPDGYEYQAHFSSSLSGDPPAVSSLSSAPPVTQPAGVAQASVTVSPQTIPLFHHPYPNFIPYNHYFSPLYVPPTAMHQYYGHTGLPPLLPSSNMLQPTPISAATLNHSPPHTKPGANAGNQAPSGVLSGYGVYNSSQFSYNPNATVASGNLSTSKDLMPTALKDKNVYSRQQSEGTGVWIPTAVQDTASFPTNSSLNIPQGQRVVYSLQPMPTLAPGHPLPQQSQLHIKSAGRHQQSHC